MAVRIETRGSQRGALACAVCIPSCCRSSRIRPSAGIEMLWYTRAAKPKALHHGRLRGVLPCERRIFSSAVVDASLSFRRECGQCLLNFYTWLRSRAASRVGRHFYGFFRFPPFCPSIRKSFAAARLDIFVGTVPLLSSRPLASVFARMDELAAAAAVVAMSVDDNAEEDAALEVIDGSAIAAHAQAPLDGTSKADKENHRDLPEGCEHGAANPKV